MGAPIGNQNARGRHNKGASRKLYRVGKIKRSPKKIGGLPVKDGYVFTGSKYIPIKQFKHKLKYGY